MTEDSPWAHLQPANRRLTLEEVRLRCARLPKPGIRTLGHQVNEPRHAGLLVPVVDLGGQAALVMTRRPATMAFHRGDWVFPGGRVDPSVDANPEAAAVREASEELGISAAAIDVIGQLASHGPIVTGFIIHPFVGVVATGTVLSPDAREVAEVATVPVSVLLADGCYCRKVELPAHEPGPRAAAPTASGASHDPRSPKALPFFRVRAGEELWGTQGEILYELLAHLTS